MPDRKSVPQQTIRVFGQAEKPAYERTVSMREVTFSCIVCHTSTTQLRYPGSLPRYCSEECRAVQAQVLNQERVRKQREKRQAVRAVRGQANTDRSSPSEPPSSPPLRPLLASKFSPPRLPMLLVERSRLLARLDTALLHPLTLLQAPAGCGKTTLVNQWITARSTHPAFPAASWVSLDAGDNDPLRFWRSVITACQTLLGQEKRGSGSAALALLSSDMRPPFARSSMEEVLTLLLNDLTHQEHSGLLVLDDYHVITEPRLHEMLTFFIDHLPQTVHVLLLSRAEPPLSLLRWRARGEMCELHGADLRFSLQETATFMSQILAPPLLEAVLTQLETSLEGWAAGLRLLSLTLSGRQTSHAVEQVIFSLGERSGSSSPHYRSLLDYFVTEILETQPEPIQRFLLYTSVLSRLSGPLCDAVTQSENSAAQLETVEKAGLFLEALDGAGEWYRYHALFAEAMRREARRRLGEETLQTVSRRASSWYEQEALLSEAIEATLVTRDMKRVARLVEQLETEGHAYEPHTMLRWLEHLPETELHAHPRLCLIFAAELRFSQETTPILEVASSRIEILLQMAEESGRSQENFALLGVIWAFRALSILEKGPFSRTVEYAQQALALLPEEDLDSSMLLWHSMCLLHVGIAKLLGGQVGEARQYLLEAQRRSQAGSNVDFKYLARHIGVMLAGCHLIQGELHQAHDSYRQVLASARAQEDHEMMANALLGLAWLAFEWNDLKGAEQQTCEAFELAGLARHQEQELRDRAVFQLALLQHVQGQTTSALQQLTALLARLQEESTPGALLFLPLVQDWQGRIFLATGDLEAVQQSLETQSRTPQASSFAQHLGTQILRGRLLLAQGKAKEALLLLEHVLSDASTRRHQSHVLEIQLLLALAHAACKQRQEAQRWLTQALSQAESDGFLRLLLAFGEPLARLLRQLFPAIRDSALRSYAQTILRSQAQAYEEGRAPHAAPISSSSNSLPFQPLSTQEERVLRLLAAGWTNQDIARELVVSVNTVKYHVKHLYQKLGVSNRQEASLAARYLKPGEPH